MLIKVYTCESESEISKNPGYYGWDVLVQFHSPDGSTLTKILGFSEYST